MSKLCIDLCSGLGGFSQAFVDAGWDVVRIDFDFRFNDVPKTQLMDLRDPGVWAYIHELGRAKIVLGSPPCEAFSVASIGSHWKGGYRAYEPADLETSDALDFVRSLYFGMKRIDAEWFIMENPRGMLRKVFKEPDYTISLCQYGDDRMKPTDLWGNLPISFIPKMCHNGNKDHQEARRGAKTGTQGRDGSPERAKMPYGLSQAILEAVDSKQAGSESR